jgi:hypothetical protein
MPVNAKSVDNMLMVVPALKSSTKVVAGER